MCENCSQYQLSQIALFTSTWKKWKTLNSLLHFSKNYFGKFTSDCSRQLLSITAYIFLLVCLIYVVFKELSVLYTSCIQQESQFRFFQWIYHILLKFPFSLKYHVINRIYYFEPNQINILQDIFLRRTCQIAYNLFSLGAVSLELRILIFLMSIKFSMFLMVK